jgi:hypothetical protein
MVSVPVTVIVPRAAPVAVQTVLAVGSAASDQVTAVLLVPLTEAVYCTVLGTVAVLKGTDAGDAGDDVTVTRICCCPPPPLPGAWAMHPTQTSSADTAIDHDKIAGRNFRKGPSDEEKGIGNFGGREREVYSVKVMLSRSVRPVNLRRNRSDARIRPKENDAKANPFYNHAKARHFCDER